MCKVTLDFVFQMTALMTFSSPVLLTSNISAKYPLRVADGVPAEAGEIPYQIAVKLAMDPVQYSFYTVCGGVLVGESKIMTAAHCFFSEEKEMCDCSDGKRIELSRLCVVAGTLRNIGHYQHDSEGTEQWRRIKLTVVHPSFDFPDNDIALVFTKHPFVLNSFVSPLPYAKHRVDYGNVDCKVSGYGRVSTFITSDSLLWAYLRLIPNLSCNEIHERNMRDFICTSSDHSNVLQGDSGGPLVCRLNDSNREQDVIVGLVCGVRLAHGTFFTRVSSFSDFVTRDMSTKLKTTWYFILLTNTRVLLFLLLFIFMLPFLAI